MSAALIRYNTDGSIASKQRFYTDIFPYGSGIIVPAYQNGGYVFSGISSNRSIYVYSSRFGARSVKHPNDSAGDVRSLDHRLHVLKNDKVAILHDVAGSRKRLGFIGLLTKDGYPDSTFSNDGFVEVAAFESLITSELNGKILIGRLRMTRYNTDGTLDGTFQDKTPVNDKDAMVVYGNRLLVLNGYNGAGGHNRITSLLLNTEDRQVKVNLYGNSNPYSNPEWNNWSNLRNRHYNNFYYSDSTASGISAVMSNRNGINDNGASYGSGMAPKEVLRHSSYSISPRTVTLSGLAPSKSYSIELYGSRNAYNGNNTVFSINGASKTVATYRNFTNKADFSNLKANAQGEIVISISSTATYNYLNGFIITESFAPSDDSVTTQTTDISTTETVALHKEGEVSISGLAVKAFPNPSTHYFTLQLQSSSDRQVQLRVIDVAGRVVEAKGSYSANTTLTFGHNYKPGIYYVEVVQGNGRNAIKLIKTAN